MKSQPSHYAVVLACLLATSVLVSAKSDVIDGTSKNFDQVVLNSPLPVLVEFFAPCNFDDKAPPAWDLFLLLFYPLFAALLAAKITLSLFRWCGHCKAMAGDWEKAATSLKGVLPVVKVDATVETSLASKYGVKGYPTIKLFTPGSKTPTDYNGGRTAKDFVEFGLTNLPNRVTQITPKSVDVFFTSVPATAPRVLLFTSKSTTPPLFKSLALRFKDKVVFGDVRQTNKDFCAQYNVDTFPTLLALTDRNAEPQRFEGKIDPEAVTAWVQALAGGASSASSSAGDSSESKQGSAEKPAAPKTEPPRPTHKVVPGATSKFEPLSGDLLTCGTLCVVALVDADEEGKANEEQLVVLNAVVAKYGKDEKFAFRWISKAAENGKEALAKLKKAEADGPLVAVVNTKRSKFAIAPEFTEKSIAVLLDRVLGGDVTYEKL